MKEEYPREFTEAEKRLFEEIIAEDLHELTEFGTMRRHFLKQMTAAAFSVMVSQIIGGHELFAQPRTNILKDIIPPVDTENALNVSFKVNGLQKNLNVDSRMTLLDALREKLELTGSKKGCDHGQCGACTVMVDGRRVLSCLTLAATCEERSITTIEGLAKGKTLHPMQAAFIKHDGFQCGFCTPGQICSAVALMSEAKKGELSYLSNNMKAGGQAIKLSDAEIRERMSGNLCRCGAYPNIVSAIREVQNS